MLKVISNLIKNWFNYPDFVRFLFVGCLNFLISYVIYVIAILILGAEHYQLCIALQWGLSSVISYFNQKILVFRTKGNYIKEYLKCCSTWAVGYLLNVIIFEILIRFVTKNVFIVQFVSIAAVSVMTYVLFKFFAFKKQ